MEEFQERELEDAQEHRRKCEVEEREALRAYRRAQRALIEANERCAILRRKRELCSAQVHGFIAEYSSLAQPLSIQNAGHGLVMPSVLNSQANADGQMPGNQGGRSGSPYPEESPQQPVDKHEARSHNFNDNSTPSDYMEDDLLPPSKRARSDCISNLEDHMEETIHVYPVENRQISGESVQDYELLEASLRSRLVERFGKKSYLNNSGEATEELSFGKVSEIEREKAYVGPPLQEADENVMTNIEGYTHFCIPQVHCVPIIDFCVKLSDGLRTCHASKYCQLPSYWRSSMFSSVKLISHLAIFAITNYYGQALLNTQNMAKIGRLK